MTVHEKIVETLRELPAEDCQKILEYAEALRQIRHAPSERKDPRGRYAHLGVSISLEDIQQARREAWSNFPRDFPEGHAK
jgi:hypothetical protein